MELSGLAKKEGNRSPLVPHNGQNFGHQDLQQHSQLEEFALTNRTHRKQACLMLLSYSRTELTLHSN